MQNLGNNFDRKIQHGFLVVFAPAARTPPYTLGKLAFNYACTVERH